jgi:hypothetical protein
VCLWCVFSSCVCVVHVVRCVRLRRVGEVLEVGALVGCRWVRLGAKFDPRTHYLLTTYSLSTHYLLTIYSLSTHTIHSRLQVRGLWKTECNKTVGAYNKHMYIPYYCRPLAFGGGQSDDQSQLEYATLDDGDTDAIEKNLKTREGEVGSGAGGAGGAGGEKGR